MAVVPYLRLHPSDAAGRSVYTPPPPPPIAQTPFLRNYPSDAAGRVAGVSVPLVRKISPSTPPNSKPATTPAPPAQSLVDYLQSLLGKPMTPQEMQDASVASAKASVQPLVDAYLASEQRARDHAAAMASDLRNAAGAAATSLDPLGDITKNDYQAAIDEAAKLGTGFSGLTRTDADAEAAQAQAQYNQLNSPVTATNLGGDLSNVLYGLGTALPGNTLASQGAAETLAARNMPGAMRAAGEQQAQGALGQGLTAIQGIEDQIAQAQGQIPGLTQQYLTGLQDQQAKRVTDALNALQATKGQVVPDGKGGFTLVDPYTGNVINRVAGSVAANTKTASFGNGGLLSYTTDPTTGKVTYKVVKQPLGVNKTTTRSAGDGQLTVITTNQATGKVTTQTIRVPYSKIVPTGRGGFAQLNYDGKGHVTLTDVRTGAPYPYQTIHGSDGSVQAVYADPKTGIPTTVQLSPPRTIPPKIEKNTVQGGYDVLDASSGMLVRHIPGAVAAKPPRIVATPKQGGWDVVDAITGQRISHVDGVPQSGGPSAGSTGAATGRVNSIATNAPQHTAAQGFNFDDTTKLKVGTQKSARSFTTAIKQAVSAAPPGGRAQAVDTVTTAYGNLIQEMNLFMFAQPVQDLINGTQVSAAPLKVGASAKEKAAYNAKNQAAIQARNNAATRVYQWGVQMGFPTDLLNVMVQSAFHSPDSPKDMPSFQDPGEAVQWWINKQVSSIPPEAQTTASYSGGSPPPFGTSKTGAQLDAYLGARSSPLKGLGATIIAAGKKYGVDPTLIVAIAGAESAYGRLPNGSFNAWGLGPGNSYPSWGAAINAAAATIKKLSKGGTATIEQLGQHYAPIGAKNDPQGLNKNWVPNVTQMLTDMAGLGTTLQNVSFSTEGKETPLTKSAISLVKTYLGTPYVWGGTNPGGFDCSGLLQYVWAKNGVAIPRVTYDQFSTAPNPAIGYRGSIAVPRNQLVPGDAVFFTGKDPRNGLPGHVGMYIGDGKFIEAPGSGGHVQISNLAGRTDYVGARRYA